MKEHYPTLRSAVEGMIEGLKNHEKLGLEINMGTFGQKTNGICFGCAATCTVLNADPSLPIHLSARRQGISIRSFEAAIDLFRSGWVDVLQGYYDLERDYCRKKWSLRTRNWEEQLPLIQEWLDKEYPV